MKKGFEMKEKSVRFGLVIGEGEGLGRKMGRLGKINMDGVKESLRNEVMESSKEEIEEEIENRGIEFGIWSKLKGGGLDKRIEGFENISEDVEIRKI